MVLSPGGNTAVVQVQAVAPEHEETGQLVPVVTLPSLHEAHTQAPPAPDFKATPQFVSVEVQVSRQEPPATDDCTFGVIGQLVHGPPTPSDDVPAGQLVQTALPVG